MELGVRLKFGDIRMVEAACVEFTAAVYDMPARALLAHAPLMEGLCHAFPAQGFQQTQLECHTGAVQGLIALLSRLLMESLPLEAGFALDAADMEEPSAIAATKWRSCSELAAPLQRLMAELLANQSQHPRTLASLRHAFRLLLWVCPDLAHVEVGSGIQSAGYLRPCLRSAGEAVSAHLEARRCEVRGLSEAVEWFSCFVAVPPPAEDGLWFEPLWTHAWDHNSLTLTDTLVELLWALGPKGIRDVVAAQDSSDLAALVRTLLFDHRFLFERPRAISALLSCAAVIAPDDARAFESFQELLETACAAGEAAAAAPREGHLEEEIDGLLSWVSELSKKLLLVSLGDESILQPRSLPGDFIGLIVDVARQLSLDPDSPKVQSLRESAGALCGRIALCPEGATSAEFLGLLEGEPQAAWLYCRPDFVIDCLCGGGVRAARSIAKWRQGDCAARPNGDATSGAPSKVLLEFLEMACLEVAPSSLASALRRLFVADHSGREAAALLLWRGEAVGHAASGGSFPTASYVVDPVGLALDHATDTLAGYAVCGLRASAQDIIHLYGIVGNARLGLGVRSAAIAQLTTFLVSDASSTATLLLDAAQNLHLMFVESLRSTRVPAPPQSGDETSADSDLEFFSRLCDLGSALLLVHKGQAQVARQLQGHRDAILDRLVLLVFHSCTGLRAAALRFAACLLFDPLLTFLGQTQAAESGSRPSPRQPYALLVPPWVRENFVLPLPVHTPELVSRPAEAAWRARPTRRCAALCQVFHRLHQHVSLAAQVSQLFSRGMAMAPTSNGAIDADRSRSSVVWWHVEEQLLSGQSPGAVLEALRPLALTRPVGGWLLRVRGSLPRLIGELSQPVGTGSLPDFSPPPCFGGDARAACLARYAEPLELLLSMLSALPQGGLCDEKALQQVADVLRVHVLPTVWELLAGRAECTDLPETEAQRLRAHLVTDARAQRLVELLLRIGLLLARRVERCLASREWVSLLAVMLTYSTPPLRRLALAVSAFIVPELLHPQPGRRSVVVAGGTFGRSLVAFLGTCSACSASLQQSFELKASLWLLCQLLAGGGLPDTATQLNLVQWLEHVDPMVSAIAWRALRLQHFGPQAASSGGSAVAMASSVSRALRALRTRHAASASDDAEQMAEACVQAELLELLRLSILKAEPGSDQGVFARQVLEAGLLTAGQPLPRCLASGHLGLRRAALRLLSALLTAEPTSVNTLLLQSGLWPKIAGAMSCPSLLSLPGTSPRRHAQALDIAALGCDVARLVGIMAASNPQMLTWLAASTDLFGLWRNALAALLDAPSRGAGASAGAAASRRASGALCCQLRTLLQVATALQRQVVASSDATDLESLCSISEFLHSRVVLAIFAEGFKDDMPAVAKHISVAAVATLFGITLAMGKAACGTIVDEDVTPPLEILTERACAAFPQLAHRDKAAAVAAGEVTAIHRCLINMFHAVQSTAEIAWRSGFLPVLTDHIISLASEIAAAPAAPLRPTEQRQRGPRGSQPQLPLIWSLRVLAALLVASGSSALAEALGSTTEDHATPLLAKALLAIRSVAEKDEAVCQEVLDLLGQCGQAKDPALPALLLQHELVQWMMRLSQRRQLPTSVFCRLMPVLSQCAVAFAGKPVLFKFIARIADTIQSTWRGPHAPLGDESRCQRLVATLNFLASLPLCHRCVTLLVSCTPSAHSTGPSLMETGALGLDFWLDLVDADGRAPRPVRVAGLRVLLAVAASGAPNAKASFITSARAVPLLLKLLQGSAAAPVPALAMNVLWLLAYNHQRALPLLRQLRAQEIIRAAAAGAVMAAAKSKGPNEPKDREASEYIAVMAGQLELILG